MFFNVAIIYRIRGLNETVEKIINENKMRVTIKKTIAFYTARIRLLDGPNKKFSSTEWYKEEILKRCSYTEKVVKIKKEFVYEQGYHSKCMVVYVVLL